MLLRRHPFFVTSWRRGGSVASAGTRDRSSQDPSPAFTDKMSASVGFHRQYGIQTGSILSTGHDQSCGHLTVLREISEKNSNKKKINIPNIFIGKREEIFLHFFSFLFFVVFGRGHLRQTSPPFSWSHVNKEFADPSACADPNWIHIGYDAVFVISRC